MLDAIAPLHPEEIKAQLRMKFGSLAAFEQARGLGERSVSQVLIGRPSRAAAEAIASELDIPLQRVSSHYHRLTTVVGNKPQTVGLHRLNAEAR
ncbi:helix-turn-helix domain-containing protein [Sphingomonas sp. SCN 67-18]|uniref:helix-turn-helix domain-containing protein n=1 Tax=uncultured Sphingomonas sp. TaxID=158754 RepID=UPI0025DD06E3|nr:helix-turn-helix domain-containing protein [Sphingomonas sp. SCN 67-18]